MADVAAVINKAITEHYDVKENLKLAGDSVTDIEAIFMLRKAHAGWSQSSIQELTDKQKHLLQAINALEQGLKRHFDFEEESLPPLFGETLMKALRQEHREIAGQIENAKKTLSDFKTHGRDQPELLVWKSRMQETIGHLLQTIEEHAGHEEVILLMIRGGLESGSGS